MKASLQAEVLQLIAACADLLSEDQLRAARDLVRANEAGIAVENLAEQLFDLDRAVPAPVIADLERVARSMGLDVGWLLKKWR